MGLYKDVISVIDPWLKEKYGEDAEIGEITKRLFETRCDLIERIKDTDGQNEWNVDIDETSGNVIIRLYVCDLYFNDPGILLDAMMDTVSVSIENVNDVLELTFEFLGIE